MTDPVHIVGGGLAGCEAAWQLVSNGVPVVLYEMRPTASTPAHKTDSLAELVCSNSFRSDDPESSAIGLLHEEMRNLNSLVMKCADQIRITFSDMKTSTICDRYPEINLAEKRRYRCVAEYLIRQGELAKLRDENGKLIKKIGNMQKAVVLYRPLPKLLETLRKSGLAKFVKIDKKLKDSKNVEEVKTK